MTEHQFSSGTTLSSALLSSTGLSIAAPEFIGIGPPGTPPGLKPVPIDVAATLPERQVPTIELGSLAVDGIRAPVFQLDGHLPPCSTSTCRSNGPARFYMLLHGANGDLIVEGEIAVTHRVLDH